MEEIETTNLKSGLTAPLLGLGSISIAAILSTMISKVNIHGLDGIIWFFSLIFLGVILPTIFCLKSIQIIKLGQEEKSKTRTFSIILTSILSLILVTIILAFIWTALK